MNAKTTAKKVITKIFFKKWERSIWDEKSNVSTALLKSLFVVSINTVE